MSGIKQQSLPYTSSPIHYSLITLPLNAIQYERPLALFNNNADINHSRIHNN
jgi:hypothetical protein